MVEREHCSVEFAKCVVLDFTGNSANGVWSVLSLDHSVRPPSYILSRTSLLVLTSNDLEGRLILEIFYDK